MKKDNWIANLTNLIESKIREPFQWGVNDCWKFACQAVDSQYGTDFEHDYDYASAFEATTLLGENGGLIGAYDARLKRVDVNYIQRGNIVVYKDKHGDTSGVYLNGIIYAVGENGLRVARQSNVEIIGVWGEPLCLSL